MRISFFTTILFSTFLLVFFAPVQAETVVSNNVSVSSHSSSEGKASVNTSIISTVNGESTEYHYSSDNGTTSVEFSEEIHSNDITETEEEVRSVYLKLIEQLRHLISLLQINL